ncbi:MAG TPA: PQQ-binding-like beta-propeller repeat protein [Prolixibacteraceae bacterium]|nr:PQQ-binding-like beta-propeller repeat protein [Prolixibacteraceae bacterium]
MEKLYVIVIFLSFLFPAFGQTSSCWPNSRGDAALKGTTPVDFPKNLHLKWSVKAGGAFKSAPVVCDGYIVAGSTAGDLLCLNSEGKLIWKFQSENGFEAPALIHRGKVFIGDLSGIFRAFDLQNGKLIWEYTTENQIMGAPALFSQKDRDILAVGSYDYYLHGVDAQTGKGLWKYESDNFLNSAPAVYKNHAVFGGCDGYLHIVDMRDGASAGKVEVATYVASSPSIVGNRAYVGDYDGGFTCIDLETKQKVWRFENNENDLPFIASPSAAAGKIIIGSRDKQLYCLNQNDGKIVWKRNTGERIDASTVINDKEILVVNMRGDVWIIDLKTGTIRLTYELGIGVINSPAVIEKAIILAGSDGNLYWLGPKSGS